MKLTRIDFGAGYLWVDKESDITGWFYREDTKEVFFDDHIKRLEVINKQRKFRFKIVAQTNLELPNVPYIDIGEEDVEALAENKYPLQNALWMQLNTAIRTGFIEGYNAAKEKYAYTEEDLRKAIDFGDKGMYGYKMGEEGLIVNQVNKYIQSLNQPPNEIEIETTAPIEDLGIPKFYLKNYKQYLKVKQ